MFAQVPKMLGTLQSVWAPEAFIVSFKLETDEQILISKVGLVFCIYTRCSRYVHDIH